MNLSPERWPLDMQVQVYGVSARTVQGVPSRSDTEPVTLLVWVRVVELFQGSHVALSYHGIDSDPQACVELSIRRYPTVRLLLGGREIGRTDTAFFFRHELAAWVRDSLAKNEKG